MSKSLRDEIMGLRQTLAQVERAMRQAMQAGSLNMPAAIVQSMRQVQATLGDMGGRVRELQSDLEAYKNLARTAALINSSLELDQVLNEVMDTVISLTNAERGYLVLVQPESGGELAFKVARNIGRETLEEADFAVSRSVVRQVAVDGEPVLTTDASEDPRFSGQESVVHYNLRSILCVPLALRGQVIGVVYADNRAARGIFSQMDMRLVTAFSDQAAIAISNARQFGRVKADLEEAERQFVELQIVINEAKREKQVEQIVETEFFQNIQKLAKRG